GTWNGRNSSWWAEGASSRLRQRSARPASRSVGGVFLRLVLVRRIDEADRNRLRHAAGVDAGVWEGDLDAMDVESTLDLLVHAVLEFEEVLALGPDRKLQVGGG